MPIVLAMGVGPLLFSTAVFHCCFHLFPWSTGALNSTLATPPHLTPPHHTARLSHYTPPMRFQSAFSIFVFNRRFQSAIRSPSKFFSLKADCPFEFLTPKADLHCKFFNPRADSLNKGRQAKVRRRMRRPQGKRQVAQLPTRGGLPRQARSHPRAGHPQVGSSAAAHARTPQLNKGGGDGKQDPTAHAAMAHMGATGPKPPPYPPKPDRRSGSGRAPPVYAAARATKNTRYKPTAGP